MGCQSNNATPPSPAIAPGIDQIDAAQAACDAACRAVDPRITGAIPGFDAPFFQAGLAGYSDAAMRIIARRHGCPCCVTESLLDRMLLGGGRGFDKADLESLRDNVPGGDEDHPLIGQVIGSDPDEMAAAALKMIEQGRRGDRAYRRMAYERTGEPDRGTDPRMRDWGRTEELTTENTENTEEGVRDGGFAAIDVNLACPVKKIRNKARGGHWLGEPEGAIAILRAVRAAVPAGIPCTVKLRRGSDDSPQAERNFEHVFNGAYELGYAWATVHGRTVEQRYLGPSRWTFLRDLVRRHPDKVIFGSGDVWEAADIFRMIAYTGVHAVSVARGCIGNPWLFRQARDLMAGRAVRPPTIAQQRDVLREHFRLCVAVNGAAHAGRLMRKFGIKFAVHHPRAEEVRLRMIRVDSVGEWGRVLEEFYGEPPSAEGPGGAVSDTLVAGVTR